MKLLTRFFLILLAAALIPVVAVGTWFLRSNEQVEENAKALHRQVALLSAFLAEQAARDANKAFAFVQELNRPGLADSDALRIVQQAAAARPQFAYLALRDAAGDEPVRVADYALFPQRGSGLSAGPGLSEQASREGRVAVGTPELVGGKALLPIAYPLPGGRCVLAGYSFDELWSRLKGLHLGGEGQVFLVDGQGRPLPGFSERPFPEGWALTFPPDAAEGWLDRVPLWGKTRVGAFAAAPSFSWRALTLQPRDQAFAVSAKVRSRALAFLIALCVLSIAGAYWLAGQVSRPLGILVDASRRVANNDFSKRIPALGWGELNDLALVFNDMMEKLKSYQDLQIERQLDEKAKMDSLVQTMPDGVLMAGFDGNIFYINISARALFGVPGQTLPQAPLNVQRAITVPEPLEMYNALAARRKQIAHCAFSVRRAGEGRPRHHLGLARTVVREGREIGILLCLRDVTSEKELEQMKDEFFHSIVHDLRGPIGAVEGFIELLKEQGLLGEKAERYVAFVNSSLITLKNLVSDILTAGKIESGTLSLDLQPASPKELLLALGPLYEIQCSRTGIRLVLEPGADPSPPLRCDRPLIERVLMNLVGNALKFTRRGGAIAVRSEQAQDEVEFSIQDTGAGIPKDKLEFVFEKYKQLEGSTKSQGYGLGLSICKKVVELHGGRIWVESEPGRGSRFAFRLPLGR